MSVLTGRGLTVTMIPTGQKTNNCEGITTNKTSTNKHTLHILAQQGSIEYSLNREGISLCGMAVLVVLVALNNKGGRGLSRVFVASPLSRAPKKRLRITIRVVFLSIALVLQ